MKVIFAIGLVALLTLSEGHVPYTQGRQEQGDGYKFQHQSDNGEWYPYKYGWSDGPNNGMQPQEQYSNQYQTGSSSYGSSSSSSYGTGANQQGWQYGQKSMNQGQGY